MPETTTDLWGRSRPMDPAFVPAEELMPTDKITRTQIERARDLLPNYYEPHLEEILEYTRDHFSGLRKGRYHEFVFGGEEIVGVQDAWEPWVEGHETLTRFLGDKRPKTAWKHLSLAAKALHGRRSVRDYEKGEDSEEEVDEETLDLELTGSLGDAAPEPEEREGSVVLVCPHCDSRHGGWRVRPTENGVFLRADCLLCGAALGFRYRGYTSDPEDRP